MNHQPDIFSRLLHYELQVDRAVQYILRFILCVNIRSGEYEGNELVIKKIYPDQFLLFQEYVLPTCEIERTCFYLCTQEELLSAISRESGLSRQALLDLASAADIP